MRITDAIALAAGCTLECNVTFTNNGRGDVTVRHGEASRAFAQYEESITVVEQWLREQHRPVLTGEERRRAIFPDNDASESEFHRRWDNAAEVAESDVMIKRAIRRRDGRAWLFGARWGAEQEREHWEAMLRPLLDATLTASAVIAMVNTPGNLPHPSLTRVYDQLAEALKPFEPEPNGAAVGRELADAIRDDPRSRE